MLPPTDWPNRQFSRSVSSEGLLWHVQIVGKGPALLCLHGTGASSHSFAPLSQHLRRRFTLVIPDLPGHGFTESLEQHETTLEHIADRLSALLAKLELRPSLLIGHSAGAAIAAHMALTSQPQVSEVIAINGAFKPFGAAAATLFSGMARWLARSRALPAVTALHGFFEKPVKNLIHETGSRSSPEMLRCYQQLLRRRNHIKGTLRLMGGWDLNALLQSLPTLACPLTLISCSNDQTVPPQQARELHEQLPNSRLVELPDLGHLGHEEHPEQFSELIEKPSDRQK